MNYKNSKIAILDYIAVNKYGVPETKGFFGANETFQKWILEDYKDHQERWRLEALTTKSSFKTNLEKYKDFI